MEKTFQFSNTHTDFQARDARTVFGWRYEPRIIFKAGKGVKLIDIDDREYYDLTSGMMCMVLGHSHPELAETIREMAGTFIHQSSWYSNPWTVEFAERLTENTPGELKVVNFAITGSEANEIAMRMALAYTGKFDVVSMIRGLHGGSLAVEALTTVGGNRRKSLGPLMFPAKANALFPPFCYRCPVNLEYPSCDIACLRSSEELLEFATSQNIAAFMVETIAVPGGMIMPPDNWLKRVSEMAKRWGALLILDECQLAPARTGKMWAMEHYGVTPDIVTWGKGLSAGMAICGTITTPEIAERTRGNCGLPWAGTYSSDPMPAAVALKQLDIVLRDNLAERAEELGEVAERELATLKEKYECIGDIRGKGLYRMLDIVKDRKTKAPDPVMAERIRYNCALEGVCAIAVKHYFRFAPPLIITEAEIKDIVGRMDIAIKRAMDGFPKDVDVRESSSLSVGDRPVAAE
ncbi:aspartate aminotransferase family protein [Limibacillus halophilus]|uniref:2,2-dialkylglycine decarboxylase (Pyruvate) n=1 Tax=Limibacillus halophilus TaxID=1579333 RepID=A0A839SW35_9PROT|nr:aspartate aminotransferase family protein [Limibacillus halophilus]MBB3067007.1 2,2-dialkylglycine decarboxylase (pyruvate) [Limibacillus halophilus]